MDWFEILMVVVFFGLPVLGQLLEKQKKPPPGELDPEPWDEAPVATLPAPTPGVPRETAEEWEEWAEDEEAEVEVLPEDDRNAEVIHPVEAVSLEPVAPAPEPVRPVLETLQVDWEAEHKRFHERYVDRKETPARHTETLAARLRHPEEARRAVLLAEILAPPKALRDDGF